MAWCRDGQSRPIEAVFPGPELARANCYEALGLPLLAPVAINERPLFIEFPGAVPAPDLRALRRVASTPVVHLNSPDHVSVDLLDPDWRGACMLRQDSQGEDRQRAALLHPDHLHDLPVTAVLRDARNRLWNVADPRGICEQVTVKLNRATGFKRLTYRFRPSKGRRHWNNACQMLRRGVATPLPIGFYERWENAGIRDSWYFCQFVPDAFSCREVFAAFRDGAQAYRGLDKARWLELLAGFVCNMHNKQVVHRDLSSGNLLLHTSPKTGPYTRN